MSRLTSYVYDLSGNIVEKDLANATKEVRAHDGRNRISTLKNETAGNSPIAGYAYGYDLAGNVRQVSEIYTSGSLSSRTINNGYDGVYRLTQEAIATTGGGTVTTTYAYDKGHNRTSKAISGGATTSYVLGDGTNGAGANQIVSETTGSLTTAYAYDNNGNRSSRTVGSTATTTGTVTNGSPTITAIPSTAAVAVGMVVSGTSITAGTRVTAIVSSSSVTMSANATGTHTGEAITFTAQTDASSYDDENRLLSLDYETASTGTGTYTYAYDYRTRRVTRTEPGPVTTNIIFNGGVSIEEYTSSAGSPTVEYIRGHDYGGGVGGLEYSVRSSTPSFNFYDSRGDVTTKTNGSGTVTYQTGYEAFGNQTVSSGTTPTDRQRASTKEEDPTGLLNEGMRYRDLSTGTFLTRDPLGFKAGPNMYTYVRQNPWTHFDPEGLDVAGFFHDFGHQLYQNWGGLGTGFYNAVSPIGTGIGLAISQSPSKTLGDLSRGASYLGGQISSSATAIAQHPGLVPTAAGKFADSFNQDGSYGRFIGGGASMLAGVGIKAPITGPRASSGSDQALINSLVSNRAEAGLPGSTTTARAATSDGMTPIRSDIKDPGGDSSRNIHAEKQVVSDLSRQQKPVTVAVDQHPCGNCGPMLQNSLPPGSRVIVPENPAKPVGTLGGSPKSAAEDAAAGRISAVPKTVMSIPPTRSSTSVPVPSASTKQNNDRH